MLEFLGCLCAPTWVTLLSMSFSNLFGYFWLPTLVLVTFCLFTRAGCLVLPRGWTLEQHPSLLYDLAAEVLKYLLFVSYLLFGFFVLHIYACQ